MLRINDRRQQHLFDPWHFLSPKRRRMLDKHWPGFFRDHVLDLLPVEKLALVFPSNMGRPTKELRTVLGALALQNYHDLTDLETVSQLAYNIQWHYALDIVEESDEAKYICPKTLWNMRLLATELGLEADVFDTIATSLAALFGVDTSHQRIDSVHIRSNMARLGRIGLFVKSINRFLVNLKRQHRGLWDQLDAELIQRYQGQKARECFAGVKPSQSKKTLSEVASDLYRLVQQFESHRQVANMSSYKLLGRIVKEQCDVQSDGTIELKAPQQISSDSLQNPSDPEATYSGHKGQGYQVQLMETYSEHKKAGDVSLITHVEVEKACQSDAQALLPAIEVSLEKDLAPAQLQADALYGSDENCQAAQEMGVEVLSPTMGTEKQSGTKLSDFQFRPDGHIERCPSGHAPMVRKKKKMRYTQGFDADVCRHCPHLKECPVKKGAAYYYLRYDEKSMRLTRRRQHENTDDFKQRYRWRAGVEATMSQYDRLTGVKHLRVRGFKAVRFAAVMKAACVNIARAVAAKRAQMRAESPNADHCKKNWWSLVRFKEQLDRFFQLIFASTTAKTNKWAMAHNSF